MSDEKKLFHIDVEVSFDMVVAAKTREEAEAYARENYKEGYEDTCYPGADAYSRGEALTKCPNDFRGCPPYNSDDDDKRTVDQWFTGDEEADAAQLNAKQQAQLEQARIQLELFKAEEEKEDGPSDT